MSLVIDMKFRETIPPDDATATQGTMKIRTTRLKINGASKLALQIMLGTMTLLGLAALWLTDLRGTLPRNPCSIASTMGFVAGSDLCDGPDPLIPEHALYMSRAEQERMWGGWMFSLGWWPAKRRKSEASGGNKPRGLKIDLSDMGPEARRFGVDVGEPEQLGFQETGWWRLRQRLAWKR
jgi:hypothetical protein